MSKEDIPNKVSGVQECIPFTVCDTPKTLGNLLLSFPYDLVERWAMAGYKKYIKGLEARKSPKIQADKEREKRVNKKLKQLDASQLTMLQDKIVAELAKP